MYRQRDLGSLILRLAALALLAPGCSRDLDGGGMMRPLPPPPPPPPLSAPRIAFASNRTGTGGIHLYDPATGGIVRLSPAGTYDQEPVISPDGTRIAFVTYDADTRFRLMTMAVDGTDRRSVTNQAGANDTGPRWSPDSRCLVFTRTDRVSGARNVCTVLAGGDSLSAVTTDGHSTALDWSPDGQFLLITRDTTVTTYKVWALGTIHPDGSSGRTVDWGDIDPFVGGEFSPDGTRIAATHAHPDGTYLDIVRSDGMYLSHYPTHLARDGVGRPTWSPDGASVVFSGHPSRETDDLFTILLSTPYEVLPLLEGPAWDSAPHWGPKP